jgi:hypothetical protein
MRGAGRGGGGRTPTIGRYPTLLAIGVAASAAIGCGHASPDSTPRAQQLQRADLVASSRALTSAQPSVRSEVAASEAVWPSVANGLPARTSAISRSAIHTATERAAALTVPGLFEERQARSLTGPGAAIAGLFHAYSGLASRGWQLIGAAIDQIEHGSPAAARFARANVALYIQSIYDAHFSLAQIGKHLTDGYRELGGPDAFGASLTQAEVDRLAQAYSEQADRLHPHPGVRLGS